MNFSLRKSTSAVYYFAKYLSLTLITRITNTCYIIYAWAKLFRSETIRSDCDASNRSLHFDLNFFPTLILCSQRPSKPNCFICRVNSYVINQSLVVKFPLIGFRNIMLIDFLRRANAQTDGLTNGQHRT